VRRSSAAGLSAGSRWTWNLPAVAVIAGFLALTAWFAPATVEAQAQDAEVLRVRQVSGPYDVRAAVVQSGLSLGVTLFAITVVDAATGQPIPDARVMLSTLHEDGNSGGKATAHNTPQSPDRYDAQMDLDRSGIWRISVELESSLGHVAVELLQLEVAETRRITGGTFVFIGVFAVLIAGVVYLWWSVQRRRR